MERLILKGVIYLLIYIEHFRRKKCKVSQINNGGIFSSIKNIRRLIIMLTRKLEEWEKAELKYKTKVQEEINNYYFDCNWDKIISYFLKDGDLSNCPLYKICRHYFISNADKYPSLMYWTIEDYFQECLVNFTLTINNQQYGMKVEQKRMSSEDLSNTYYTNINEMDFYSSILAHCKFILLEYVKMTKRDKTRINYSSCSLEQLEEVHGDNLSYMTLQEATWSPQKVEEEKTKSKRGRPKGSKNKNKSK